MITVFLKGTTISPWIVTLDALQPFACDAPQQVTYPFLVIRSMEFVKFPLAVYQFF